MRFRFWLDLIDSFNAIRILFEFCVRDSVFRCKCVRSVYVEKSFPLLVLLLLLLLLRLHFRRSFAITIKLNVRMNDLYGLTNISISKANSIQSKKYYYIERLGLYVYVVSMLFVDVKCLHMLWGRPICSTFTMFVRLLACSLSLQGSIFGLFLLFSQCVCERERLCFFYIIYFRYYIPLPFEFFIRTTFNGGGSSRRGRSSRSENWIDGSDSKVDEM